MEKKGNRNIPHQATSCRVAVTDSKKAQQDGVGGKLWPRGGRRREPTNSGSLNTKQEPSRKPQPQRVQTFDKRPKPRGNYQAQGALPRTRLNEEQEAELGSVFLPGSKKQSLNHLLNFVYHSPRDDCHHQLDRSHHKGGSNRLLVTKKHKYNKEHFIQANCQFIVNKCGDYKQYMNNPDALVDWNLVEQVNVQVTEFPSCPICLYPPVAAKMTRCGHIYCWPCVLHYLTFSDKTSSSCPICHDAINKKDLKSVIAIPHATFNITETITFKLMKRARDSLTAYPADSVVRDETIFNMSETDVYSKLLLANQQDIMSIIEREERELQRQLEEEENTPEACFIEQAKVLLDERRGKVLDDVSEVAEALAQIDLYQATSPKPVSKYFYFYQAADGQHIYLHSINAKMLEHTYGSLEFGPKTITGKILEKEGGSMTEELRQKMRYLQHLPVTCQFEVAEIQLRQPVVGKDTLENFQVRIDERRKTRQRRAKEEKRREKRIAEEENRRLGKYPTPNIQLESHQQFPEFGLEPRLRSESEPSERSSSPDLAGGLENTYRGPSFATMLAKEKKVTPTVSWPGLPASSPKLINVTGAKMTTTRVRVDSEGELDDFEPVPAFHFGDAILQALQHAEQEEIDSPGLPVSKKKKKKNKQKVLFTTNMAYSP